VDEPKTQSNSGGEGEQDKPPVSGSRGRHWDH
jgi:hypothetical protein